MENQNVNNKRKFYDNFIYVAVIAVVILFVGEIIGIIGVQFGLAAAFSGNAYDVDFWSLAANYLDFIGIWIAFVVIILIVKHDRWLIAKIGKGKKGNTVKNLLIGLLIGFLLNGFCILIAVGNNDISLYFDSVKPIKLILMLIFVFIQSSAEELACRMFIYEKLNASYKKPIVAIAVNSLVFGMLHLGNDGITVTSMLDIVLTGLLLSFAVYYMDSLWCAFGIHTAWNYTQNIIFGLPNSGMFSTFSIFKLDAYTAQNTMTYNIIFGIEGTFVSCVVIGLACVAMYAWGKKFGVRREDF